MNAHFQRNWMRILVIPLLFVCLISNGNPLGEAVRAGGVQFERTDGGLRILQGSDKAIIDWDSFSIGAGEFTEFVQPSERSAALNRVRGVSVSQIDGALRANGNVILINPNGIVIGPSGTIDVGGFIASTLDISDAEFLAGGDLNFSGTSQQRIVNLGSISATGGDVFLIAATVENSGTISAPNGTVGLAAGNDVLLKEAGTPGERIFVRGANGEKKANGVINKGTIDANIAELKAHGGNVYALAVNNEGRVAATGVSREGGQIFLRAGGGGTRVKNSGTLKATRQNGDGGRIEIDAGPGGEVENSGTVDVSSETGNGGQIFILGSQIHLEPGSLVIADGETGGGEIFIGGGQRGQNGELMNAENVTVSEGATISANGTGASAAGGQVIVFAENRLDFSGMVSAAGGENGDGGFIELSGKNEVLIPDLSSRVILGGNGTLLFDPNDILIVDGAPTTGIGPSPVTANSIVDEDIANFLTNIGNLTIETDSLGTGGVGNITFQNNTNITWMSANSLTVNADESVILQGGATGATINSQGSGAITLNALGGEIGVGSEATIQGSSGDITLNSARGFSIFSGGSITTDAGDITIASNNSGTSADSFTGIRVQGGQIISNGDGAITLNGKGGNAAANDNRGVYISGAVRSNSTAATAGSITINGTGGNGTGGGVGVYIDTSGAVNSVNGAISITGQGNGTGNGGDGILLEQSQIISTGTGANAATISLNGTGSSTGITSGRGIGMIDNSQIQSIDGDVTLNGTGGGSGAELFGVLMTDGSRINTTGDSNISVTGFGANGSTGIQIDSGNTAIGSATATGGISILSDTLALSGAGIKVQTSGDISINAEKSINITDAAKIEGSTGNIEIISGESTRVQLLSEITTTTGDITLTSNLISMPVSGSFDGILLDNATVSTTNGNISLSAVGGTDTAGNRGIRTEGATIRSTGTGNISLNGTGGEGGVSELMGVGLLSNSTISTANGNIDITGVGGGDGTTGATLASGIDLFDVTIQSLGNGNVSLNGTGGNGTDSTGVRLFDDIFLGGAGDLTINGTAGSGTGSLGIATLLTPTIGGASATGDISLLTNSLALSSGTAIQSAGDLHIFDPTASSHTYLDDTKTDIDGLQLGATEIATFQDGFNSITFGHSVNNSGNIFVNSQTFTDPLNLISRGATGKIVVSNSLTGTGNASITLDADISTSLGGTVSTEGEDITIKGRTLLLTGSTVDSTAGGNPTGATIEFGDDITGASISAVNFTANAGTQADIIFGGDVGTGTFKIDQLDLNADNLIINTQVDTVGDIDINTAGKFQLNSAGNIESTGTISITANAGAKAGNFNGIDIRGDLSSNTVNGGIMLNGTSGDTAENVGVLIASGSDITSSQAVEITGESQIGTIAESAILVNGLFDVDGIQATSNGGNITINERVEVNNNLDLVGVGAGPFHFNITSSVPLNRLSVTGGTGSDTLSFSGSTTQRTISASQLTGIEIVIGSDNTGDVFEAAPTIATDFDFTGVNIFTIDQGGNTIAVSAFESVVGSQNSDTFAFSSGGSLSGNLDGGVSSTSSNALDYSNFSAPVAVDLADFTASGIGGSFSNIAEIIGSAGTTDQITLSNLADTIDVDSNDSGDINGELIFQSIESINSGGGNDTFNFNGLATFTNPINGGLGDNTLNIFTEGGFTSTPTDNNVNIFEGQITINPTWNFSNFQTVGVDTGAGNDSVTTQFTSFNQNLNGGTGSDTLNFSQAPFGAGSPVTNPGSGSVFFQNFEQLQFALNPGAIAPPTAAPGNNSGNDPVAPVIPTIPDNGDLLQIQLDNALQDPNSGNEGVITFADSIGNISSNIGIGALQNAFSAIGLIGQQGIIFVGLDNNPAIAIVPFSLNGTGLQPSNFGIQRLQESLAPDANTELLAALGLNLGIFLINPDGPFAIDLSGTPTLPGTIQALLGQLSPHAQADLQNALEFSVVVLFTPADGVAALDTSGAQPQPATINILNDLLGQAAINELNAALGIQ